MRALETTLDQESSDASASPATQRSRDGRASLADLRSRRLAEMDGFLANRDRDLDPELLNRAQRRRCGYKQAMRLKDKTQHARMVHAHHARRRDAAPSRPGHAGEGDALQRGSRP